MQKVTTAVFDEKDVGLIKGIYQKIRVSLAI